MYERDIFLTRNDNLLKDIKEKESIDESSSWDLQLQEIRKRTTGF